MLDRPSHPHTVESLAQAAGMSRSSFAERFSDAYGSGPMKLLRDLRMHLAASLLTESDLPAKRIAVSDPGIEGLLWPGQKALGEFELVGTDGSAYDVEKLKDRWNFVFFGYTHCPDICPITMQTLRQVRENLSGRDISQPLNFLFVSLYLAYCSRAGSGNSLSASARHRRPLITM